LKSEGRAHVPSDLPLETSNWKLGTSKLGSFRTFHSPAGPRPTRQPPLPTYPSRPKFGFVLHNCLPSAAPGRAKLGSFRTLGLFVGWASPPGFFRCWPRLASFRTFHSRPGHAPHADLCLNAPFRPSLALFCAFTARPGQIGFVLPDRPRPVRRRATRPRRELGLFCAFTLRRAKLGLFCTFCLRGLPPVRSPFTPFSPSHFSNLRLRRFRQPIPPLL
jgi:hypothetical protein